MNTGLGSLRATTWEAGWLEGAVARAVRAPLVLRVEITAKLWKDDTTRTSQNCSF